MNVIALIILVFAFCFACFEAWRASTDIKPTNWGWVAFALLILVQLLFRGQDAFFK